MVGMVEPLVERAGRAVSALLACNVAYLHEVLERTTKHPINRIDELLPWNIALGFGPRQAA
jgi:hypothetical protein